MDFNHVQPEYAFFYRNFAFFQDCRRPCIIKFSKHIQCKAYRPLKPQRALAAAGISIPRNSQPPTPPLTTSDTVYTTAGMQFGGQLLTQHSSYSGAQYALSPADSPRYAISPDVSAHYALSSGNSPYTGSPAASSDIRFQHRNTPSPGHSPPVSPLHAHHQNMMQLPGPQQR